MSGHLYIDTNGNSTQDGSEPDLANVDVLITDSNGATQTVTTDANGDWSATVPPGLTSADVDESDPQYPTGYIQTEGTDPTSVTAVAGTDTDAGNDGYYLAGIDLSLTKSVSNTSPAVGSIITFTVNITNAGPSTATGVVVEDALAAGFTFVNYGTTQGSYSGSNWTVGTLAAGQTETFVLEVTVNASGPYTNIAQVSAANETDTDSTPDNDIESEDDQETVTITTQNAVIGISKETVSVVRVAPGTFDVTFDLVIENFGPVDLTNIQITDDLINTFPSPVTFTIRSLSSSSLSLNTSYDGDTDLNLLDGSDTLPVGASRTMRFVTRVIPDTAGPYTNTAIVTGNYLSTTVTDNSQDGADPDPDTNDDPTDNNDPTPVVFPPNIFDPPFGFKLLDDAGLPILQWTMIWINDNNFASYSEVSDPIPAGTTYEAAGAASGTGIPGGAPAGSTDVGVSCTPDPLNPGGATTTTFCYYEGPTVTYPRGRIIWIGDLGPDLGATNQSQADNEMYIVFGVRVNDGVNQVNNIATIDADLNNDGDIDDPGEQIVASASEQWSIPTPSTVDALPNTGFAPGLQTVIPVQPTELKYNNYSDLALEIPSLKVNMDIMGVPFKDGRWDVTWLGNQAGYLNGTAFPTWKGNSVLTAHVYDANGKPGPFVNLSTLRWGDRIIIHAFGQKYIYEVRTVKQIDPDDTSILAHKDESWITLITCKEYNEATNTYLSRIAVQAVLIRVETE